MSDADPTFVTRRHRPSATQLGTLLSGSIPLAIDFCGEQLHFANPHVYNEIYNAKNKWDKDTAVYRAFDMPESSACFIKYKDAKIRRDVLSPMFSRSSILKTQDLIQERVSPLFFSLTRSRVLNTPGHPGKHTL